MEKSKLREIWLEEEKSVREKGCCFSQYAGRYDEERGLPWDMRETVKRYLEPGGRLLEVDAGGGEFLLSLGYPPVLISATESDLPLAEECRNLLSPMGVDFQSYGQGGKLPFGDGIFNVVINRHGCCDESEVARVLKKGGVFITEQVGAENDKDMVKLLLPETKDVLSEERCFSGVRTRHEKAGLSVIEEKEAFRPLRFYDVGALVWFVRMAENEFPSFSVETHFDNLLKAQEVLEQQGFIESTAHRYFIVSQKS